MGALERGFFGGFGFGVLGGGGFLAALGGGFAFGGFCGGHGGCGEEGRGLV